MKRKSEAALHALLEDVANQLRFLAEVGVPFLDLAGTTVVASPSGASHHTVVFPCNSTCEPEANFAVPQVPTAPTLETRDAALPGGGHKPLLDHTLHRQLTLQTQSKTDSATLSRNLMDCNQAGRSFLKPQQSSLFEEPSSAPEALPADATLEAIRADLGDCQRCKLAACRTNIVFGEGAPQAPVVFVGEGPGAEEDATGRPFVGRAGQLLDKIIAAMGLRREEVYICNVVKCRPPENRTPEPDEVAACVGFLHRQLAVIRPRVIVALGASAASALLGDSKLGGISKIRGRFYDYRGIPLMPTFHPAYLLRAPDKKREVWEDIKQVMALLRECSTKAH